MEHVICKIGSLNVYVLCSALYVVSIDIYQFIHCRSFVRSLIITIQVGATM